MIFDETVETSYPIYEVYISLNKCEYQNICKNGFDPCDRSSDFNEKIAELISNEVEYFDDVTERSIDIEAEFVGCDVVITIKFEAVNDDYSFDNIKE